MPQVLNKRTDGVPDGAVYVGRPSKYGNPFTIGKHGTRDQVIAQYTAWLMEDEQEWLRMQAAWELHSLDLVCWCAPLPCHANVLLKVANGEDVDGVREA